MAETPATNRIRTRAMNRALARLRNLHRPEYEQLLEEELEKAYTEAKDHIARVRREHADEEPPAKPAGASGPKFKPQMPLPPRLLGGPRSEPVLRDDVAKCPYCKRFHDRGHECPSCRHRPAGAPPKDPYARTG